MIWEFSHGFLENKYGIFDKGKTRSNSVSRERCDRFQDKDWKTAREYSSRPAYLFQQQQQSLFVLSHTVIIIAQNIDDKNQSIGCPVGASNARQPVDISVA